MILKNKVALVLGGIKGIGKGIGLALANEGAKVAINYFDWEDSLEKLKQDFAKTCKNYMIIRTDLNKPDTIQTLIDQVVYRYKGIDILINNIERGGWPVVHGEYIQDQWDLEMATTLRAKRWVFYSALPYLKLSKEAVVINISSIAGIVGRSGPASYVFNEGYAAANRGISSLTETWARIGAPNVRVNEIMIGFVETRHGEKTRGWDLLTDKQKKSLINHTLLKRTGKVEDIIKAALYIIKDAPFMTGNILRLDGGYILGGENVKPMPKGILLDENSK